MSGHPEEEDVVQQLHAEGEEPEYITEDDVLEVEELEIDGMDHESDGEDDHVEQDGAEELLDNGYDDSHAQFSHGVGQAVFAVSIHPSTSLLAVSGGADDTGRIWRTDTGKEVAKLTGHEDSVTSVGWSFDGELVATGGMDGRVRVWRRVKSAAPVEEANWEFWTNLEGPDEVNWIEWHPKGALLLAGGADGTVWIWSLPTGNTLHVLTGHIAPVTCGRWTPDGKKIVTCSEDSTLILWDPRTGQPIHKLESGDARFRLDGGINTVAINPAGTVAICGGAEGGLRAVNLVQGTVLAQMNGHEEGTSVEAVVFSEVPVQGGSVSVVVSAGTDKRVCTWEANTFKLRSTAVHEDAVTCIAFAPSTTFFVTGSADKTLKVWDYRRGSCERTILGPRDVVHACSVSRDGKIVVSGGDDGARVFTIQEQKKDGEDVQMS